MDKYIKREAALHEIERREALMVGDKCVSVAAMKSFIKNRPAADVVPVVRCKDCKYYRAGALLAPIKFCFRLKHPVEDRPIGYNFAPDDFCSRGERKDDDSDALD